MLLLLLTSTAISNETYTGKHDNDRVLQPLHGVSWQAAEVYMDVIEEFGSPSRNYNLTFSI